MKQAYTNIQVQALKNIMDSKKEKTVRYGSMDGMIALTLDGFACHLIPADAFHLEMDPRRNMDFKKFFDIAPEYSAAVDTKTTKILNDGQSVRVLQNEKGENIYISEKVLKQFDFADSFKVYKPLSPVYVFSSIGSIEGLIMPINCKD